MPLDLPSLAPPPTPASTLRNVPAAMADRLIVALDVRTAAQALDIVARLDGIVGFYKIGFRLQIAPGFDTLMQQLLAARKRVFLDAKMFDVPETVEQAVAAAADRGVSFITVHGDRTIMAAAVRGKASSALKVFAVTVLTSLTDTDLNGMGYRLSARDLVNLRADQAVQCGCDGIIASADDNPDAIRRLAGNDRLLIATPGIRTKDSAPDDQKRTATPCEAIASGADYLVVGRPIIAAPDMAMAARSFISEMDRGQAEMRGRA